MRISRFTISVVIVLLLCVPGIAATPGWYRSMKKISLLHDSYDDVIRILRKTPVGDSKRRDSLEYFQFREGRLAVTFEPGNCGDGMQPGWDVPKWTVVGLMFAPDTHIRPQVIGLRDFNGFTMTQVKDDLNAYEYESEILGERYIVKDGLIEDVTFAPPKASFARRCTPR